MEKTQKEWFMYLADYAVKLEKSGDICHFGMTES